MPDYSIQDVIQASLALQRQRIETAAFNVARANVPLTPGGTAATAPAANTVAAQPFSAPSFADQIAAPARPVTAAVSGSSALPNSDTTASPSPGYRLALEPQNPAADANGVVRYPDVDLATEMTTMMSATRAYEASVRSFNILKSMTASAMTIGK